MTNIEAVLSGHNKKLLSKTFKSNQDKNVKDCNCRGGTKNCVLNGKCLSKGVVYKAEVMSTGMTARYIGIAANSFKERYTNHKLSFNNLKYEYNTSLSKHIWGLKKINEPFTLFWLS